MNMPICAIDFFLSTHNKTVYTCVCVCVCACGREEKERIGEITLKPKDAFLFRARAR